MKHLYSSNHRVGCRPYKGSHLQYQLVMLACANYGHLIRTVDSTERSFGEFADIIERHYDTTTPQNREVVKVLREVDAMNPVIEEETAVH